MARVPPEVVEQIRQRVGILELVGSRVALQKRGRNHFGLCPFHPEKTPSFSVAPEKGIFKCFGCGAGGDVFDWLMQLEGLSFGDAAEELARRAGIILPGEAAPDPAAEAARRRLDAALALLEAAASFFETQLLQAAGERVRQYLTKRSIEAVTVSGFRLGFAGESQALARHLQEKGVDAALAVELGLLGRRDDGSFYCPFAGRLMFPIWDARGRVIAFGGRTMRQDDSAKYINSPQSLAFDKGHVLYAWHLARRQVRQRGRVVLVEGYMDVLACHQAGVGEATAVLGTAFTAHHARLVKEASERIVLGLDTDAAGRRAAISSGASLLVQGLTVHLASWPGGKDPADLVQAGQAALVLKTVENAPHIIAAMIEAATSRLDGSVEGTLGAVGQVAQLLAAMPGGLQRDLYIAQAAERFKLSEDQLRQHLAKERPPQAPREPPSAAQRSASGSAPAPPSAPGERGLGQGADRAPGLNQARAPARRRPPARREVELVVLVLANPPLWERAVDIERQLEDERLRAVLQVVARTKAVPSADDLKVLVDEPRLAGLLDPKTLPPADEDAGQRLQEAFEEMMLDREIADLQHQIEAAPHDDALLATLSKRKLEATEKRNGLRDRRQD